MMPCPLSDDQLREWAAHHLVYEARMLASTAVELGNREDEDPDEESNAFLESFIVHVRCLGGFLWGTRQEKFEMDAFAEDFCEEGVWRKERWGRRTVLSKPVSQRVGREVVHLSYERLVSEPDPKEWPVGSMLEDICTALVDRAIYALPERMDGTRAAIENPSIHSRGVGPTSVATGMVFNYRGGGDFPNLHGS